MSYDITNDDSYELNGNIYDENIQILVKDKKYFIGLLTIMLDYTTFQGLDEYLSDETTLRLVMKKIFCTKLLKDGGYKNLIDKIVAIMHRN